MYFNPPNSKKTTQKYQYLVKNELYIIGNTFDIILQKIIMFMDFFSFSGIARHVQNFGKLNFKCIYNILNEKSK